MRMTRNQIQRSIRSISSRYRSQFSRSTILSKRNEVKFSTDAQSDLQESGILDKNNLLQFDTLHELQSKASIAFKDNRLFGTYYHKDGQDPGYEWMNYKEFDDKVASCRAVLKNLGK